MPFLEDEVEALIPILMIYRGEKQFHCVSCKKRGDTLVRIMKLCHRGSIVRHGVIWAPIRELLTSS